ncbi:molybdenum cofactor synthesis domain protein [Mycobacterium xenopi 3993]|nr:molybdenum cofactor synthesis domain protein [Mycobacterium xenopi 3993]
MRAARSTSVISATPRSGSAGIIVASARHQRHSSIPAPPASSSPAHVISATPLSRLRRHHRRQRTSSAPLLDPGSAGIIVASARHQRHSSIPAPPASSSPAHVISATPRSARMVFAGELVQGVVEHVGEHPETVAHSAGRAGQVDDQGAAGHTA